MNDNFKLSSIGKLFFANLIATTLLGQKSFIKLKGTPQQIKALTDAIKASKEFQDEIKNPNATVDSVIEKLRLRNLASVEFGQKTNKPWPL